MLIELKNEKNDQKLCDWQEHALHDRFPKLVSANSDNETWLRLQKGKLKREAESLSVVAQD